MGKTANDGSACISAQVSPSTLFLIEGCGQLGVAMNWGDGYVTDSAIIKAAGLADPNPFFQALLSRPYLNNVVISPHYYPPSVSTATSQWAFSLFRPTMEILLFSPKGS